MTKKYKFTVYSKRTGTIEKVFYLDVYDAFDFLIFPNSRIICEKLNDQCGYNYIWSLDED